MLRLVGPYSRHAGTAEDKEQTILNGGVRRKKNNDENKTSTWHQVEQSPAS